MISYEFINNELENNHKEYKLMYWRHLVKNEPIDMKLFAEKYRPFFSDKRIKSYIEDNIKKSSNSDNQIDKRKWLLLKNYFSKKAIEYNEEIVELYCLASNLMLNGSIKTDDKDFGMLEIQNKISSTENKQERTKYIKLMQGFFDQYKQKILDVVKRRNNLARELGYTSYIDLFFENNDISFSEMKNIISLLKERLIKTEKERKMNDIVYQDKNAIMGKYFSKENAYNIMNSLLKHWEISSNYENVKIVESDNSLSHHESTECIDVSIPDDIRIFINSENPLSDYIYCLFHELGHAIHFANIKSKDFIFKILPGYYCEAMAALLDKFLCLEESLNKIIDNQDDISTISKFVVSNNSNVFLGNMISTLFEMELYSQNYTVNEVDELFEKLIFQCTGIRGRLDWGGFVVGIVKFPFYINSYLLAHIISSQIISSIYNKFGSYLKPEVYEFIRKNYYMKGNEHSFQNILLKTTNEKMNPEYFFKF